MKGIVAVDKHWGIGKDNKLLYRAKEDMKLFKGYTLNKVVVMGRKTFDSLPNREPLKDRMNIVISNRMNIDSDNLFIGNLEEVNAKIKEYDTDKVFIIGGASIYKEFMNRIDTFYVSHIDISHLETGKIADTYMPNLIFENFLPDRLANLPYGLNMHMHVDEWKAAEANGPLAAVYCTFLDAEPICMYTLDMDEWKCIDSYEHVYSLDRRSKKVLSKILGSKLYIKPEVEISQGIWRSESDVDYMQYPRTKTRGIKPIPAYFRLCGFGSNVSESFKNFSDATDSLRYVLLK